MPEKKIDFNIEYFLKIDEKRRKLLKFLEELNAIKNQANKRIQLAQNEEERKNIVCQMQEVDRNSDLKEREFKEVDKEFKELMLLIPNIPDDSVPVGDSDLDNKEIRKWGKRPDLKFEIKDHIQLAQDLDLIDFEKGARVAGFRGYFLKREAVLLCFAIWQYTLDILKKKGFTPIIAPSLVKESALIGTGYLPQQKDEVYSVGEGMYLAGTAEVPLMSYHANEILEEKDLPLKYVGFSPCFRTEIGSYGKDTQGILRVHEFMKLEQVVICQNSKEESVKLHEEITKNAEEILQGLEIPYRVVLNCTGDLGLGQVKKYDIECWVPSQNRYRETHSSSYFLTIRPED